MENLLASKLHNLTFIKTVLMLCVIAGHSEIFGMEHGSRRSN